MKRDMDLVRQILIAISDCPTAKLDSLPEMPPASEDEVAHHAQLLVEGGYVDAIDLSDKTEIEFRQLSLTWAGHEFLDSVRDPEVWSTTKAGAKKIGSWSIAVLADLAKGAIVAKAHSLGLPIGG